MSSIGPWGGEHLNLNVEDWIKMLILALVKADCSVCMNIPVFLARVQTKKKAFDSLSQVWLANSSIICAPTGNTYQLRWFSLDDTENPDSKGSGYDITF